MSSVDSSGKFVACSSLYTREPSIDGPIEHRAVEAGGIWGNVESTHGAGAGVVERLGREDVLLDKGEDEEGSRGGPKEGSFDPQ